MTSSHPRPPWGLSLIGSLPSHMTFFFSIKNPRPILFSLPSQQAVKQANKQECQVNGISHFIPHLFQSK